MKKLVILRKGDNILKQGGNYGWKAGRFVCEGVTSGSGGYKGKGLN